MPVLDASAGRMGLAGIGDCRLSLPCGHSDRSPSASVFARNAVAERHTVRVQRSKIVAAVYIAVALTLLVRRAYSFSFDCVQHRQQAAS